MIECINACLGHIEVVAEMERRIEQRIAVAVVTRAWIRAGLGLGSSFTSVNADGNRLVIEQRAIRGSDLHEVAVVVVAVGWGLKSGGATKAKAPVELLIWNLAASAPQRSNRRASFRRPVVVTAVEFSAFDTLALSPWKRRLSAARSREYRRQRQVAGSRPGPVLSGPAWALAQPAASEKEASRSVRDAASASCVRRVLAFCVRPCALSRPRRGVMAAPTGGG